MAPGRRTVSGRISLRIMMPQTKWPWPSNITYANSTLLGVWGQSLLYLQSKFTTFLNKCILITTGVILCPNLTSLSSKS